MKLLSSRRATKTFTVIEVLVVIAFVVLIMALLMPVMSGRPNRPRITWCMNNLRQIDISLACWAADHNQKFPPQVSITNGGSKELIGSGKAFPHFQAISNYVGGNWRFFVCPADKSKQPLTNSIAGFTDQNLSYFISVDATPAAANAFLAGDRNLQIGNQTVKPGLITLTTSTPLFWTQRDLHSRPGYPWGNIIFPDNHVESFRTDLAAALQRQDLPTNRLAVP